MNRPTTRNVLSTVVGALLLIGSLLVFGLGASGCVPQISNLSAVQAAPGKLVTVNGASFGATTRDNRVYIGSKLSAEIISADPAVIKFMTPYAAPGTYTLTVKTAMGTSNAVNFTILSSASSKDAGITSAQPASYWIRDIKSIISLTSSGIHSPYYERVLDSSYDLENTLAQYGAGLAPANEAIEAICIQADEEALHDSLYDMVFGGLWNGPLAREALYTFRALLEEASVIIAQTCPVDAVESALNRVCSDLEAYASSFPAKGDSHFPRSLVQNLQCTLQPNGTYVAGVLLTDDIFADSWNSGIWLGGVEIFWEGFDFSTRIAVASCGYMIPWVKDPLGVGYYHRMDVGFHIPWNAQGGQKIRFQVVAMDTSMKPLTVNYFRTINQAYNAPTLTSWTISDDDVKSLTELGNSRVTFNWADSDSNVSSLKVELIGEHLGKRSLTVPASSLGITGGSGSFSKTLSQIFGTELGNCFKFDKDFWVLARIWLVDSQGQASDSAMPFVFIDGPEAREVFGFDVGDSLGETSGSRSDDEFEVQIPRWPGPERIRRGGTAPFTALLGDIVPGVNPHLTIKCTGSTNGKGTCKVTLKDGARFTDNTTTKTNENIAVGGTWELDIVPPANAKPPRPGS